MGTGNFQRLPFNNQLVSIVLRVSQADGQRKDRPTQECQTPGRRIDQLIWIDCCRFALMKKYLIAFLLLTFTAAFSTAQAQGKFKFVIIRHAEKQDKNDNLSCAGLNRSLKLAEVLHQKIGIPAYVYIPSVGNGARTTHSRMFQTVTPFAVTYNLNINSKFKGDDFKSLLKDLSKKEGLVLFVWNHENIAALANALGIAGKLEWKDSDFDTIWTITGKGKSRKLQVDKENIIPQNNCAF